MRRRRSPVPTLNAWTKTSVNAERILAMAIAPERLVAVALANKLARICWAIMTTGEDRQGDVRHSVKRKAIGKISLFRSLASATRRDERHGRHRSQGQPFSHHERKKLAAMIGTKAVGLHQGQRPNAPRQKAGHMTAADQAAHNVKNRLPTGAVHI